MRGRAGLLAVAAAVAILLAGCADPVGTGDGDIGGDWAVLPKGEVPVPASGVCRTGQLADGTVDWQMSIFDDQPVPCTQKHATETYYVGRVTDAKTVSLNTPPEAGDAAYKAVYVNCMRRAYDFLGDDYHRARVSIVAVLPTPLEWRGDARFYRCEMLEISNQYEKIVERSSSLKNGLKGSRPAAVTCANFTVSSKDYIKTFDFVPCSKSHLTEFTGLYTPKDGKYPGEKKSDSLGTAGCLSVGARYVNMSVSALDAMGGYEWVYYGGGETKWSVGDRVDRCYLGKYPRSKRTGSIKGKSPRQW
jgi:hypothetical protein